MTKRPIGAIIMLVLAMAGITVVLRLADNESAVEIARQFYYLPIIYAGLNFSITGAISVSLVSAYLSATRGAQTGFEHGPTLALEDLMPLLQLAMFFIVGYFASAVSRTIRRRVEEAQQLYEVARSITTTLRLRQVLDLIATSAQRVMDAKACGIRLLDKETGELRPVVMHGLSEEYLAKGSVSRDGSVLDQQVLAGEPVQILDVRKDSTFQYPEAADAEGLRSVLSVPLRSKDEPLGVIRVYAKGRRRFRPREVDLLMAFAHQAATAIENAELYEDIRRNYYETIRALTTAIEARDPTTYNHSERVTELADRMAAVLAISQDDRETLRFGCILHDVGKIGVEESAMDAREPNNPEAVFYRMHPLVGRSILQPIGFLTEALPTVVHHHEKWDGTGFPEGLAGERIPLHARLCCIVDAYDRLRNPQRSDRQGLSVAEAVEEITAGAGSTFDPKLVATFRKLMEGAAAATDTPSPEQADDEI